MKRRAPLALALSFLLGMVLLGGCIKDEEPEPDVRSGLAVVNAFLEAEGVLHRVDVGKVGGFEALNFRSSTKFDTSQKP